MNGLDEQNTRTRTAVIISIAAHVCALLLLAELLGSAPFEPMTLTGPNAAVTMFVHRERRPGRPGRAMRAAMIAARPTQPEVRAASHLTRPALGPPRQKSVLQPVSDTRARAVHPVIEAREPSGTCIVALRSAIADKRRSAPAIVIPIAALAPTPIPTRLAARVLAVRLPTQPPTPMPTPESTPVPTSAPSAAAASFAGLFSQNYPPAFAAAAELDAIRARLSRPVHIRVDVDEAGRATDVRFVQPVTDDALAQEVRSALLALRYVPADCNGLHCAGTLEIAY